MELIQENFVDPAQTAPIDLANFVAMSLDPLWVAVWERVAWTLSSSSAECLLVDFLHRGEADPTFEQSCWPFGWFE